MANLWLKGFKSLIYFNDQPMEFEIVSDVVSHSKKSYEMWFGAKIKTPIG